MEENNEEIAKAVSVFKSIEQRLSQDIIGQDVLKRRLLTALLTSGHILLEGVPGLAKTRSINALAQSIDGSFKRVQFTPDLLPADLTGTEIYRPADGTFSIRKGPIFANFVLADEINRAPAKVQSALLEIMQEHQVTIGDNSLKVPEPFLVMATQNPVEQDGTYPLPEAQVDRFLMKVKVDYPSIEEETKILNLVSKESKSEKKSPVASLDDIERAQNCLKSIYLDDRIKSYIVNIVAATRNPENFGLKFGPLLQLGASPRASISLLLASKAEALLNGDSYVVPQNVKDVTYDILRHRVILSYEAEARGLNTEDIIKSILDGVEVP